MRQKTKTVAMGVARLAQRETQALGLSLEAFCAETGVRREELAERHGRIDAARYGRVLGVVSRYMLDCGRFMREPLRLPMLFDDLPHLTAVWCNSASLGDAVLNYVRYRRVLGEPDAMDCEVEDGAIALTYRPDTAGPEGACSAIGNFAVLMGCVHQYLADGSATERRALAVDLHLAAPIGRATRLAQDALGLVFRPGTAHRLLLRGASLWAPAQHFNPVLHELSRRVLDQDLQALDTMPSFAGQTRAMIEQVWSDQLDLSTPALAGLSSLVAERLGVSRWTLRRRLEDEGQTFQSLLDGLRARHAQSLLREPGQSMLDISQRLGFATQSSFNRFYRKHFDCTPMQTRLEMRWAA